MSAAIRSVLLARTSTPVEQEIVARFATARRPTPMSYEVVHDGATATAAARASDLPITPARVVWLPPDGGAGPRPWLREFSAAGLATPLRAHVQRRLLASDPECCRVVVGDPARLSELAERWAERAGRESAEAGAPDLAAFVERQADIAVERAERRLTGERYRTPRHVVEELATDPRFVAGAEELARSLGRNPAALMADALDYLEEMATEQQRWARDVWTRWAHYLYSRAYQLRVDPAQIARLRELSSHHPLVFLPSHRSNLDGYVMASLLHEHGFPPNHTLGGINMAFWPIGPLGRRVGVIWIRRSFRRNEVYKYVLRRYLGYLVSKRFNLEWYIEGSRSRTGKLLPPRLGLFNYLADAVEELGIDDLRVIPVSIVYDELQEAREMTTESHGAVKQAEGLRWLVDFARAQRGAFGAVNVTFGEPLVLASALRSEKDPRLARSKAAFEVCARINRVTPVTPVSLVTLALLGADDRALTLPQVRRALAPLLGYVRAGELPGQDAVLVLESEGGLRRTLTTLEEHGVVARHDDGLETVYRIGRDHELVAAFYRNQAIHWFVTRAIVELALVRAAEAGDSDPAATALEDAFALRDLLKFEFFFAEKSEFLRDLQEEVARIDPRWQERPDRLTELGEALSRSGALMAARVLRSFIEAYVIAADQLASLGTAAVDADAAIKDCLRRGRQYLLQRRVARAEAVSSHLFRSALQLAANRGLLDGGGEAPARRAAFAAELGDVLRRLRRIAEFDHAASDPDYIPRHEVVPA